MEQNFSWQAVNTHSGELVVSMPKERLCTFCIYNYHQNNKRITVDQHAYEDKTKVIVSRNTSLGSQTFLLLNTLAINEKSADEHRNKRPLHNSWIAFTPSINWHSAPDTRPWQFSGKSWLNCGHVFRRFQTGFQVKWLQPSLTFPFFCQFLWQWKQDTEIRN